MNDVLSRSARPPDLVLRCGDEPDHVADVHLPPPRPGGRAGGREGFAFILFLHGGFWREQYGREHTAPLAAALASTGFIVCAPEYRRTGQVGGGWPGTFSDVAAAVDRLPGVVAEATWGLVDQGRVVLGGHSAGGHLALWAASRHRPPAGSPWRAQSAAMRGVVALAPVSELAACYEQGLGRDAASELMGGSPEQFPDRYAAADPAGLVPTGVPVWLVHGAADDDVPAEMSAHYAERARASGDDAMCEMLPGVGHLDLIDPLSGAWERVAAAFRHAASPGSD